MPFPWGNDVVGIILGATACCGTDAIGDIPIIIIVVIDSMVP